MCRGGRDDIVTAFNVHTPFHRHRERQGSGQYRVRQYRVSHSHYERFLYRTSTYDYCMHRPYDYCMHRPIIVRTVRCTTIIVEAYDNRTHRPAIRTHRTIDRRKRTIVTVRLCYKTYDWSDRTFIVTRTIIVLMHNNWLFTLLYFARQYY